MKVFYISYIYKPATSSHTKPGLFETTSLTWLPTDSWISPSRKSSYFMTSELELQQIPELRRFLFSWLRRFMTPDPHRFANSGLHWFKIPDLHEFTTPSFAGPGLRIFASSRFRSFTSSRFQILAGSRFLSFAGSRLLKTYVMNFIKLGVSRVTGFPEFPNRGISRPYAFLKLPSHRHSLISCCI
jgi:hypothetical protein